MARKAGLDKKLQIQRDRRQNGTSHGFQNASARLLAHRRALREENKMKDDTIEYSNVEADNTGIYDGAVLAQCDGQVDSSEQMPDAASRTAFQPTHNIPRAPVVQDCLQSLPNTTHQSVSYTSANISRL